MMWAQIINALLGVWLMASPTVFGYAGAARTNDVVVGPIATTFAIIALWEVTRMVGKANVVLGVWLVIVSWVLGYENVIPMINDFVVGIAMVAFAMRRGKPRDNFAGGWRSLMKPGTPT
jgi:hypothetical protein